MSHSLNKYTCNLTLYSNCIFKLLTVCVFIICTGIVNYYDRFIYHVSKPFFFTVSNEDRRALLDMLRSHLNKRRVFCLDKV